MKAALVRVCHEICFSSGAISIFPMVPVVSATHFKLK